MRDAKSKGMTIINQMHPLGREKERKKERKRSIHCRFVSEVVYTINELDKTQGPHERRGLGWAKEKKKKKRKKEQNV